MDKRYYIEITGRNGTVASRHMVSELPCRIGRGYDMELILDDPSVAPAHLMIREAVNGLVDIVDLGSMNGVYRIIPGKKAEKINESAPNDQDALWRIGQTTLRIRSSFDPVAPETPMPRKSLSRSLPLACSLILLYSMYCLFAAWMKSGSNFGDAIGSMFTSTFSIFLWAGAWAMATRLVSGNFSYIPHMIIGGLMFLGFDSLKPIINVISFAFGLPELPILIVIVQCGSTAAGLFFHLRLVTCITGKLCLAISTALAFVFVLKDDIGSMTLKDPPSRMRYNTMLMPPYVLLSRGDAPIGLINDARQLKKQVDDLRNTEDKQ